MKTDTYFGPPGTGKTRKMLDLMAQIHDGGVPTDRIGFVSFTKAACAEAMSRLGLRSSKTIRTIHSWCYEICKADGAQMVDHKKLQAFASYIGYEIKGDNPDATVDLGEGDIMLAVHQFARARLVSVDRAHRDKQCDVPFPVQRMFSEGYDKWKKSSGFLDFDDLLDQACATDIDLGVDYLFVDEAQDLTPAQWRFVVKAATHVKHVILAGDDDQCIYAWGGADPHGMTTFDPSARVSILEQSYRVPRRVHQLAQTVIERISNRVVKAYRPTNEPGTVEEYGDIEFVGPPSGDVLILIRNHKSRREVEPWLIKNRVHYTTTGNFQTPANDRYANAVRAFNRMKRGDTLTPPQQGLLEKHADPRAAGMIRARKYEKLRGFDWWNVLMIPPNRADYLREIDLESKPTVRLSTIHAAKGMEADRVVLFNSMGERTYMTAGEQEHRVWYVGVTRARHALDIVNGDNPYDLEV